MMEINTGNKLILEKIDGIEGKIDRMFQLLNKKQKQNESEYVTVAEAAVMLRRSEITIRRLIKEGKIKAIKPNGGTNKHERFLVERKSVESIFK